MFRRLKHGEADMTDGVIWKQLFDFAVPMAIGLLFQQLYNTVDTIVVGRFVGKEALAAVGSTSSIINMLVGLCAGLAIGASVVISQRYGAHDQAGLRDAVHTTVTVTLILCVLATAAGIWIIEPMLHLMAMPPDVFPQARQYLLIYFAGVSGLLLYNMGAAILRAVGDSARPLYFLCISAVTNIILDLLFVVRFGWGIAGVGYATIIAQFLSAFLALHSLTNADAAYGIHWKRLGIDREKLKSIFAIGLPSGVQQAITSFSNVFVQSYINFFGAACMAGWSSYIKLDVYVLIPVQSIAMASTTFVGQNVGAGNLRRAREGVRQAVWMSILITILCSGTVMLCAKPLIRLFTTDAEVVDFGARFITLISPFYVLVCFNQIYAGALRGVGNAKAPMLIMLFSFVAFRQLFLYVNKLLGGAFIPVAIAYPMGWALCSLLMTVAYRKSPFCRGTGEMEPVTED